MGHSKDIKVTFKKDIAECDSRLELQNKSFLWNFNKCHFQFSLDKMSSGKKRCKMSRNIFQISKPIDISFLKTKEENEKVKNDNIYISILIFTGITGTCVHDNLWFWNVHKNSCRWVYPPQRKLPQKSVEHHGLHCRRFRVRLTFLSIFIYKLSVIWINRF